MKLSKSQTPLNLVQQAIEHLRDGNADRALIVLLYLHDMLHNDNHIVRSAMSMIGRKTSEAKAEAARKNGAKGGRRKNH